MWLIQTALTRAKDALLKISPQQFEAIAFSTAAKLDADIDKIAPNDPTIGTLSTATDPAVDSHLSKLHKEWAILR
nr:hypothetical protein [Armatimonadota bacterium]